MDEYTYILEEIVKIFLHEKYTRVPSCTPDALLSILSICIEATLLANFLA